MSYSVVTGNPIGGYSPPIYVNFDNNGVTTILKHYVGIRLKSTQIIEGLLATRLPSISSNQTWCKPSLINKDSTNTAYEILVVMDKNTEGSRTAELRISYNNLILANAFIYMQLKADPNYTPPVTPGKYEYWCIIFPYSSNELDNDKLHYNYYINDIDNLTSCLALSSITILDYPLTANLVAYCFGTASITDVHVPTSTSDVIYVYKVGNLDSAIKADFVKTHYADDINNDYTYHIWNLSNLPV